MDLAQSMLLQQRSPGAKLPALVPGGRGAALVLCPDVTGHRISGQALQLAPQPTAQQPLQFPSNSSNSSNPSTCSPPDAGVS